MTVQASGPAPLERFGLEAPRRHPGLDRLSRLAALATATLTVPVTITTADDRVAEKRLRFLTVNESGWWVCEVSDAS